MISGMPWGGPSLNIVLQGTHISEWLICQLVFAGTHVKRVGLRKELGDMIDNDTEQSTYMLSARMADTIA
eukprot:16433262-Heterocapsa_arctica.AAC.1